MSNDAASFDSDALRANTPGTPREVVIPERYRALLTSIEQYVGVHTALSETLTEYFHPHRNLETIVAGLGDIQLRYWAYLGRQENAVDLFDLISELSTEIFETELSSKLFSALLRSTLTWCKQIAASEGAPAFDDAIARTVAMIATHVDDRLNEFLERDTSVRDVCQATGSLPQSGPVAADLYRRLLKAGYARLDDRLDVPAWALSQEADLTDPQGIAETYSFLSGERIASLMATITDGDDATLRGNDIPTYSQILASTLAELPRTKPLEDRFAVSLFLLKDDALGYRQQNATSDLLTVVKQLVKPEHKSDIEMVLTRLTEFFKHHPDAYTLTRLQAYEAIGTAIGAAGNEKAADHLLEDLISWDFQYPDIAGATDEWETLVNPHHLPTIRCWMHIIESNPALYERLAAALNVHLRLGGVYIADTDLFQRDVTQFLHADIRPIYFVAKQLLRVFPVYYHEVGAEGELRAASTQFDEINTRHDTLLHFLRKQVHAESSNRLVPFSREVVRYWLTLETACLEPYLSPNTMTAVGDEGRFAVGPHALLTQYRASLDEMTDDAFLDHLLESDQDDLLAFMLPIARQTDGLVEDDAYRVARVVRTHQLLEQKYSLTADEAAREVKSFNALDGQRRDLFVELFKTWQAEPTPEHRNALLRICLRVLLDLKEIILDPTPTTADERLYHKRHIAAGIPSIYGSYKEPKFDALSLSLRVEALAARLLEDIVNEGMEPYVTRSTLRRIAANMKLFERALAVDGIASAQFGDVLRMLVASFSFYSFTFHQDLNIFQMLARAMSDLSSRSVRSHGQILRQVLTNDPRQAERRGLSTDAVAELVLRDVLVSGLGIQALDRYVSQALRKLSSLNEQLPQAALTRMMNYDPERLVWPLHTREKRLLDLPTLGFKGYGLCQMAQMGIHVPEGFVLSTELFHASEAMTYRPLFDDTRQRVRDALTALEQETGLVLGDAERPLLLSVRSGSPISMPGLMTTFVNVGLTAQNVEAFAARPGRAWETWDSYRRFIQSWAMSHGVEREVFGAIINEAKQRHGVAAKSDFSSKQMREIALAYREAALAAGVVLHDDPFEQVLACIWSVVGSWDEPDPVLYRNYTNVAENWGTACICQRMVFGNMNREAGSGVVFTTNPLEPYQHQVRLFGDFATASQGEDLVGGLVFPLPVSEAQRLGAKAYENVTESMETKFPELYAELLRVARLVAGGPDTDPQEIEFTFESPRADGLYILQKRAVVPEQQTDAPYFDLRQTQDSPVAVAMGVSGGAYPGRVALVAEDVDRLVAENAEEPILLVRPDTVPEDLALLARVGGVLTGRGGATSHAAVTAKRLAKTAVVGCQDLEVNDRERTATIGTHQVRPGDWVSIDGRTGQIFVGRLATRAKPLGGE